MFINTSSVSYIFPARTRRRIFLFVEFPNMETSRLSYILIVYIYIYIMYYIVYIFYIRDVLTPPKASGKSPPNDDCFVEGGDISKTIQGILRTNAYSRGTDPVIFTRISRFNHACSPNCDWCWDDAFSELRIYAGTSIGAFRFQYSRPELHTLGHTLRTLRT